MPQPLTDAINALTTYANSVTGKTPPDTTLSDAVATLASGYGGGSDPYHLATSEDLVITNGSPDWRNTYASIKNNGNQNNGSRRGVFSLKGTTEVYLDQTTTLTRFHLIPIPTGATKFRFATELTCQFAVREYMSSDGIHVTASADTTGGFIDTTADIGAEVTLTGGYTHIAIGMRTNANSTNYTVLTSPVKATIDFS